MNQKLEALEFEAAAKAARSALLQHEDTVEVFKKIRCALAQTNDAWTAQARMLSAIKRKAKSVVSYGNTLEKKGWKRSGGSTNSSESSYGHSKHLLHTISLSHPSQTRLVTSWVHFSKHLKKKKTVAKGTEHEEFEKHLTKFHKEHGDE